MVNRHVWLDIEQNIIFGQQSIWPIRWNLNPVWPVKSRQMSIKVAQKWFHNKNEIFGHLYQNWLKCGRFGLNNCCHRLKKLPRVPKIAQYCHTAWIQHLFFSERNRVNSQRVVRMLHRGARALRRNCPRIFGPAGVRVELDARRDGRRVVADAAVHPDREADVGEGDQGRSKHFYFSCRFSTSQKDRAAQHLQGNENYIFKVVAITQSKNMIAAQLIYSLTRLDLTK